MRDKVGQQRIMVYINTGNLSLHEEMEHSHETR